MRILCILWPHFPLRCEVQRQRASEEHPAMVFHVNGSQRFVLDYSPELDNLYCGMTIQQAVSRHGDAGLIRADLPYYLSIFNDILSSLETKSPLVEGTDLGCIYLGLDGLQSIYRSDSILVAAVREVVPETFSIQIGIGEGKFLAYLAARRSSPGKFGVLTGDVSHFLKDLTCDVLPVSAKSKQKLHDFGLHTLGQIAALPLGPMLSQFGPEGKRIWELVGGHDDTPLYPRFSEEVIEERATLPSVTVSLEAIFVALEALLARVFARDSLRGRGIRSLALWANIWGSGYWERHVKFKEPAMNTKKALSRIKQSLAGSPPPGPVEELGVKITGLGYSVGKQRNLFSEVRAKDHLLDDVKQLEFRLGSPQVFRVKEVEPWSRIPERRQVLAPINQ